jgi:hypothetical protein
MSGRFNWSRISSRDKGNAPLVGPTPKARRKLSKAELREQAAAAFLAWREGQKAKDK